MAPDLVGEESEWQLGPPFLRKPREDWPLSLPNDPDAVPLSEVRKSALVARDEAPSMRLQELLGDILSRMRSLRMAVGITARVVRALSADGGREGIAALVTPRERLAARKLLFMAQQAEVCEQLGTGKLSSLSAGYVYGAGMEHRGLVVTRGRVPRDSWKRLVGMGSLPVLLASSRLSYLIVREVHDKGHRKETGAVLAMSRREAWIVAGRRLVKSVVKDCMLCRRISRVTQNQIIGDLGDSVGEMSRPFQVMQLDIMGPFRVKGLGGNSRVTFKAWAAVMACTATKAVAAWVLKGYSTADFLLAWDSHVAIYGHPTLVVTDRGSQIVAAAGEAPNWDHIQFQTAPRGTCWRFVPPATPWRNGLAEQVVGLMKRNLTIQIETGALLEYAELSAMLHRVAGLMNDRPLSARSFSEGKFFSITPKDLLLGAAPCLSDRQEEDLLGEGDEMRLRERVLNVDRKVEQWWRKFIEDVFPLLVPRRAMRLQHPNLMLGDIVLLKYEVKYGHARYRLARVVELHPDRSQVVRTVSLRLRDRRRARAEGPEQCRAGGLLLRAPVQRLVVILPASEQPPELLQKLQQEREARLRLLGRATPGQVRAPEQVLPPAPGQLPLPAQAPRPHPTQAHTPVQASPPHPAWGHTPAQAPPPHPAQDHTPALAPLPHPTQDPLPAGVLPPPHGVHVRVVPAGDEDIIDLPRPKRAGRRLRRI